jgi:hypothetical protein
MYVTDTVRWGRVSAPMTLLFLFFLFVVFLVLVVRHQNKKNRAEQVHIASLVPVEREAYLAKKAALAQRKQESQDSWNYGSLNPHMICQHCGVRGRTRTKRNTTKQGISGGKATAALLTGGVSLLATGLSRKVANTQAHCGNCRNVWYF